MRILIGAAAGILWMAFLVAIAKIYGGEISGEMPMLTTAIIVAGAMAGGEFSKEPVDFDMMEQSEDEERKMMEEDE